MIQIDPSTRTRVRKTAGLDLVDAVRSRSKLDLEVTFPPKDALGDYLYEAT